MIKNMATVYYLSLSGAWCKQVFFQTDDAMPDK